MTRRGALLSVVVLLVASCNQQVSTELGGPQEQAVVSIPAQVLGLRVTREDIGTRGIEAVERPYVDSLAVFSLREDDLLQATLQVSRLNRLARPRSAAFQRRIVSVLGAVRPVELRVGGETVYATSSNRQSVFVWFEGRGMFVLSVRQEYEFPRTLLRRVLGAKLR